MLRLLKSIPKMASRLSGISGIHAENVLKVAAKMLLPLPSSGPELLDVLEQMERNLSWVDQMPSKSIKYALHSIVEALIAQELVRHRDTDVNILVLCCNCEILRIMAPDSLYNDEQLKDFFELATKMFEKLSSASTKRYPRLSKALIMFREINLAVVMSDLELDKLVVQLFKQFLTIAKSNSPDVVREMEMIMTNIIKEFDGPMLELVRLLLMSVRKTRLTMFASPVCRQLGEKVLKNCGGLLKPYLPDIIRERGIPLEDYSEIVAHICNGVSKNEAMVPPEKQDDASKLRKDTTDERKLDCTEGSSNLVQTVQQATMHTINLAGIHSEHEKTTLSTSNDPIICVQGYKVKNNIAPIFEAIFMKHGDIAAKCVFNTDCVRASFLELVCEVVTQLQTNDDNNIISMMEELESKVSEAEAANIRVSWLRSHLEALKKSSSLMETKAKTSMVIKAAEMEVRKRREELMAAQQRFEKAERCVKVLDLVEQKLNSNILDSKTEPIV